MKATPWQLKLTACLVALSAIFFLPACAETEAHNNRALLSAAGFRTRTPETAQQKAIYDELADYRMARVTYKKKTFYVFKDAKNGIAYVGHEPEYQRYMQLCVQQRIAQDYYMASSMNAYYGTRWYGAYGYRSVWW